MQFPESGRHIVDGVQQIEVTNNETREVTFILQFAFICGLMVVQTKVYKNAFSKKEVQAFLGRVALVSMVDEDIADVKFI